MGKFIAALLMCVALAASAAPIAQVVDGDVTITIYSEPCKLANVPKVFDTRITFMDKGKSYEGCATGVGPYISAYFPEDESVVVVPVSAFKRVNSI